jgi:hypothetical protein
MAISYSIYEVGDTPTQLVPPSLDTQKVWIQNLEPQSDTDEYARAGFIYQVGQKFAVASPGTVTFNIATGTAGLQIEYFEILSDSSNVTASLIEGATVTTSGAAIPAYNLNRNITTAPTATLSSAASVSGGSAIAIEYLTADKHAAGGGAASQKIYTLKPSEDYVMEFVNNGNQATNVFLSLGFSEKYNGLNQVWLGSSAGSAVTLRGHEMIQLDVRGNEEIVAVSNGGTNTVVVMRQD